MTEHLTPDVQRILRQHVRTDALLGVESLPVSRVAPVLQTMAPPVHVGAAPAGGPPETAGLLSVPPPAQALDRDTKLRVLQELDERQVRPCTRCELHRGRLQTVFGEGDPDAPLMFIGEGPGQTEDETGRPFVGRAGELLNKMIVAMKLTRENVYIANIVKCRPPNNRAPLPPEVAACSDYLRRQVLTIQPRVIVTLGGPAAKHLLQTDKGITAIRGIWHQCTMEGRVFPVMPTFHPAYLLRAYTEDNRKKVWSDLQQVMTRLKG